MNKYALALESAWKHMLSWHQEGKFSPRSEEDIQCFLYHGLVTELGTAKGVCPKHTTGKDGKLFWDLDGKLHVGNMHFPDLLIGPPDGAAEVAVEIKYRRNGNSKIFPGCVADVEKLKKHHADHLQYFVVFDEHPDYLFMDEFQQNVLKEKAAPGCRFLFYPELPNPSKLRKV